MGRIPKANKLESPLIPEARTLHVTNDGIVFSFEALERTEYFNLDGTCYIWFSDMLDMCKEASKLTATQLRSGSYKTFRFLPMKALSALHLYLMGLSLKMFTR